MKTTKTTATLLISATLMTVGFLTITPTAQAGPVCYEDPGSWSCWEVINCVKHWREDENRREGPMGTIYEYCYNKIQEGPPCQDHARDLQHDLTTTTHQDAWNLATCFTGTPSVQAT